MRALNNKLSITALCGGIFISLLVGCSGNDDPIASADKSADKPGISAPSIVETKKIAEDGFLYGLPIVMNYAVMNEYCVDKNSGQYKAPFNTVFNETRVFTYKDTAVV
ncbi:MAG: hypothetical protein WBW79_08325, partial [Desulfocapsaceae bacterium]